MGETPKTKYKEKQMNQIVFEMNNKTTLKGEREKELTQETSEHIWTTCPQAKGKRNSNDEF